MYERIEMQRVPAKMGRVNNGKRRKLSLSKVSDASVKIAAASVTTSVIGTELVRLTLEQRGYFAIGGEWIAMIMVFIGVYRLLSIKEKPHT